MPDHFRRQSIVAIGRGLAGFPLGIAIVGPNVSLVEEIAEKQKVGGIDDEGRIQVGPGVLAFKAAQFQPLMKV